jgi:hypothetical protein
MRNFAQLVAEHAQQGRIAAGVFGQLAAQRTLELHAGKRLE